MCGITAFFSRAKPASRRNLEQATRVLNHRGPDDQRLWLSSDGLVGLGHARLSIIDLAGGAQPLANEDQSVRIIVNGEFYDFERIRDDLERRGHVFRTRSDSEIALHLYEEVGAHCLPQLRGEFAFTLWDEKQQVLFAARDRFGIKPLFYAWHREVLYLASEIKALLAAGVPARWDHENFYHQALGPALPDRTFFEGIYQIPPGHYLLATKSSFRILRYWDFDYPPARELAAKTHPDEYYVEQFRYALDEAVRLRMRADVSVACYLSGGLDSCAVLGLAARHINAPINAFTLSFDEAEYDESKIAQEMAQRAGARFRSIPIRQSDLADHFGDALWHAETLFMNGHGVSKFLLSRAVRDAGYKVVYTGEGSDEILGGYAHFRRDMLLHNTHGQEPKEVERLLKELNDNNPVSRGMLLADGVGLPMHGVQETLGFVPAWLEVFATMAAKRLSLLSDDFEAAFAGRNVVSYFLNQFDVPGQLQGRDPLNQALYLWSKSTLANYILVYLGDRMEMAHSIEGRLPFLDHHVVECLRAIPVSLKIRGVTEKFLLREAAKDVLTDTVYRRQKHPFLSPPATTRPSERLHQLLNDTLRGSSLAALPFFDSKKVVNLLDRLPTMPTEEQVAWDPILTSVLSACVLRERFGL